MSKESKLIILSIFLVVFMAIGFTYAYFMANIEGDKKNITINMTDLRIVFNGGDSIEGTNLYASDNFDVVKTFTIENKTKNEYKYNLVIEDLINTTATTGSLVYKITCDDTNGYNMTEFKDLPKANNYNVGLAYNIPIASKSLQTYTIEIKYINKEDEDQSIDMGSTLSGKLFIEKGSNPSLTYKMLNDNPTRAIRTDFSVTNTANTTGTLYQTNKTEDNSTVYYYSGNTTNNWVKFGKWTNSVKIYRGYNNETSYDLFNDYTSMEDCTNDNKKNCKEYIVSNANDDMYWRIIRTNEDGSIRLLYSGTNPNSNSGFIGTSKYKDAAVNVLYEGYMYGTSGSLEKNRTNENDSIIKTYIDDWYNTNLLTNYDKYISKSAIYCNDRSIENGIYPMTSGNFGSNIRRLYSSPTYKCGGDGEGGLFESIQSIADKFSVSTEGGGNGQLTYPVAMITLDEFIFAGGNHSAQSGSSYAWYYFNSVGESITDLLQWWTMSPSGANVNYAFISTIHGSQKSINDTNGRPFQTHAVRPAISLSSCVKIASGDGTPDNPYVVDYENSCIE